jgi:hypothetical protein
MFSRDLFLMWLRSWEDWPSSLDLPSQHFCLLIAGDARAVSQGALGRLAGQALAGGCVYLCAWGPDCERVHDCFDMKIIERDIAGDVPNALAVMTTWHEKETLDEAIDFLTEAAWPDDAHVSTCRSSVMAVVGNADWAKAIEHRFKRISGQTK